MSGGRHGLFCGLRWPFSSELLHAIGPPRCLLLVLGQAAVARTARSLLPQLEKAGDQPSAHPLSQRLPIRETTTWPLRSLLEG